MAVQLPNIWADQAAPVSTAIFPHVSWAAIHGVWGWQHRMDPGHIKNYPLTLHVVSTVFEGVLYTGLGFAVAVGVAMLFDRATGRTS